MNNKPRSDWQKTIKLGLLGGVLIVFVALLGMVEAFEKRDIINGVIDMGRVLLLVCFFLVGTFAVPNRNAPKRTVLAILQAALAGFISSLVLNALVLLMSAMPTMRNVFVNATPTLLKSLEFGQDLIGGMITISILGIVFSVIPALLHFLPGVLRTSLISATTWVILVGLLQELLTVTFQTTEVLKSFASWLFGSSGLSVAGALVLFVIIFVFELARARYGKDVQTRYTNLPTTQRQITNGFFLLIALAVLLVLPSVLGLFFSEVLVQVGLYVLMGLGLNIVVGFAGLLDLGYVAFFAVGAYTVGILTSTSKEIAFAGGLPFWVGLPIAIAAAAMGGIVLGVPVLKVRGDYLAIVTLGFGEIIRLLALSDFLKPFFAGARGLELIPKPFIGSFELAGPQQLYYLLLIGCIVVAFIAIRLKTSRVGRAWMAMREDEDVAQAMGINLVATKLLAFAMGASFAGIGGAINASKLAIIYPHSFNFMVSINVLALIIIGGMGSIPGVILGALVLVGLPELLREFADFRLLIYGAVLVLMMLVRPEGLLPEARRAQELEEFREEETAETSVASAS
jgi:branched-chain amino acid transport system permease protein